jgi:glutamate-5-semialdehyde dehydrogenase
VQLNDYLEEIKKAKKDISILSDGIKKDLLYDMADEIVKNTQNIIKENKKDLDYAKENNLTSSLIDRLLLDEDRIIAMSKSLKTIALLKNPVNKILDGWDLPNGMSIQKVSVPIGVIGVIYESRPNVTSDVAGLCIKSGNVAILKGGKEAKYSNAIIIKILQSILNKYKLNIYIASSFIDSSREGVAKMIKLDRDIDLIIPRGGSSLISYVNNNSTVPVVKHDKGVCHIYVDKYANIQKALDIVVNAKTRRFGVCNAMECMIVHNDISDEFLVKAKKLFDDTNTLLKGCEEARKVINIDTIKQEEYYIEYLDNILNIKVVDSVSEAIEHISKYGSGHSDSIVSENLTNINLFTSLIASACVYVNASTAFTDGAEFGFGAEVGISTNKLHSRGPMGIDDLTTYKFKIIGDGHIRK